MVKELMKAYGAKKQKLDVYLTDIKNVNTPPPTSMIPEYLKEVIIPVIEALRKGYPELDVDALPENYGLVLGYYRISLSGNVVGGLSYPVNDDFSLYYTPIKRKNGKPTGARIKIKDIAHLAAVIRNQSL